jgi:hypothetical protein
MLAATLCCGLMTAACSDDNDKAAEITDANRKAASLLPEASRDYDKMADYFQAAIKIAHPHLKEAWNDDVNPEDFNMFYVNEGKTRAYLINPTTKKEIPQSEWSEQLRAAIRETTSFAHARQGGVNGTIILFKFDEFDEVVKQKKTVFGEKYTLEDYVFEMVALFYHEAFHAYVQNPSRGWNGNGSSSKDGDSKDYNRNQSYPVDYKPRVYRKMALLALKAAWDNPAQKDRHYARAKYWTNKYEKEYPQEAAGIKKTDIDEGTADFFERNLLHPLFNSKQLHEIDGFHLAAAVDTESYMSSIAIWLAKRDGRLGKAIANFKQESQTPINFLLKDVPVPVNYDESQDAADKARVEEMLAKMYDGDSERLLPVKDAVSAHKTGKMIYLGMPLPSSFYSDDQGVFDLLELPGYSCALAVTASTNGFDMNKLTVMSNAYYFLVPTTDSNNLTVTNVMNVAEGTASPLPDVTLMQEGRLTAVSGIKGLTLKSLPADVSIGKDNYGNTYYLIKR